MSRAPDTPNSGPLQPTPYQTQHPDKEDIHVRKAGPSAAIATPRRPAQQLPCGRPPCNMETSHDADVCAAG
eukprot:9833706-Lingulodinium_polyedra.AAC.1